MDNRSNDMFGDDLTFNNKKIDDFAHLKGTTMDFLASERSEKIDDEKQKEPKANAAVDDFLNFHDDIGESDFSNNQFSSNIILLPSSNAEEKKNIKEDEEIKPPQQPEIDFNTLDDEYLNPYAVNKSLNESTNERFISSEDLLNDFKDPIPSSEPEKKKEIQEVPKVEEPPKETFIPPPVKQPEPIISKPVIEEPKQPKASPIPVIQPPPSSSSAAIPEASTTNDTQIEAEKIFKSIGLG